MNRDETLQAAKALSAAPAASWIGNKFSDDGTKLLQRCTLCGAEETLELPQDVSKAFRSGARGDTLARLVPANFDEKLFVWKREFQKAHEDCGGGQSRLRSTSAKAATSHATRKFHSPSPASSKRLQIEVRKSGAVGNP